MGNYSRAGQCSQYMDPRTGEIREVYYTIQGDRQEVPLDKNPYSYSRFCVWKSDTWSPKDEVCYSDRIGITNGNFNEKFMDQYTALISEKWCGDKKIILTGVEQECNVSNGYPYLIFYFRYAEPVVEE